MRIPPKNMTYVFSNRTSSTRNLVIGLLACIRINGCILIYETLMGESGAHIYVVFLIAAICHRTIRVVSLEVTEIVHSLSIKECTIDNTASTGVSRGSSSTTGNARSSGFGVMCSCRARYACCVSCVTVSGRLERASKKEEEEERVLLLTSGTSDALGRIGRAHGTIGASCTRSSPSN